MKYKIYYTNQGGKEIEYGLIEWLGENMYRVSTNSPHYQMFLTLEEAINYFDLVDSLEGEYIQSFRIERVKEPKQELLFIQHED